MRVRSLLAASALSAAALLASCSDPTGPTSANYVHVLVQNASATPIYVPAVRKAVIGQRFDIAAEQLLPGAAAEILFVTPDSGGGGIPVYEATDMPQRLLGVVWFTFVRAPASAAGLDWATIRVVAPASGPLTVSTDRPDLISLTGVTDS